MAYLGNEKIMFAPKVTVVDPSKLSELVNDVGYITSANIEGKADKADTLSGYGITDAYTKEETDQKVNAKADKNKILDYITYEIIDNSVTITGYDKSISGAYIIPNTIEGYPVTKIGLAAFAGCNLLTSISIPDSVTLIYTSAFTNCTALKSVTIGNGVLNIWGGAFSGCTALESVTIGDSVIKIDEATFRGCNSLTSITIPDSVTEIGLDAFAGCDALQSVTLGNGVTSIDASIFSGCNELKKITIGNGVTSICDAAFRNCNYLGNIAIPNSVTMIGNSTFENCYSLTIISIPDSVTKIGNSAFRYCTALKSITIPNGVTTIGDGTFEYCYSLTSITIPVSVTKIGASAFQGWSALKDVYYGGTKEQWDNITIGENNDTLSNATIHFANSYETYSKAETDALINTKRVSFVDGDIITLADNTTYYAEGEISSLTIVYPDTDFICSLEFTLASQGDITITLPQSKYIGGTPTLANGETWELNIKNKVVVGGLVE